MNTIKILGSGTSTGVPILSCNCKVCKSRELRNQRLRSSALIRTAKSTILIDASPDLRTQLLNADVQEINAVIITHDHADHTHGMDDLRPYGFKQKSPLPVYTNAHTADSLKNKFPYIFQREKLYANKPILGGGIPLLDLEVVEPGMAQILEEDVEFFLLPHGHGQTLGLRHEKMAYLTDCHSIPEDTLISLEKAKLQLLIIDCLRPRPHDTHLHLDLTLEYIKAINPKLAVLTHMGHEWDYLELISELQKRRVKNIVPAVDGQSFPYSY